MSSGVQRLNSSLVVAVEAYVSGPYKAMPSSNWGGEAGVGEMPPSVLPSSQIANTHREFTDGSNSYVSLGSESDSRDTCRVTERLF